jgi:hypothetical protein
LSTLIDVFTWAGAYKKSRESGILGMVFREGNHVTRKTIGADAPYDLFSVIRVPRIERNEPPRHKTASSCFA